MQNKLHISLFIIVLCVLIWSGIDPHDRLTWWLETLPAMIALIVLPLFYKKFRFTDLLYILIAIHCIILCVGGKYTYAKVPFGFWMQDYLGLARNHYDRIGHLAQGFIPAILAREILIRNHVVKQKGWLFLFVTCICLSFSVIYEFIEWIAVIVSAEGAAAFLGTQGDIWDTHWDMFLALLGAIAAQLFLNRKHDHQIYLLNKE